MRVSLLSIAACALAAMALSGCESTLTAPTNAAPYGQVDLTLGTGPGAVSGQILTVNYTGWLYDSLQANQEGAVFDATTAGTPFVFTLGNGSVIKGWDQGLVGMQVGGVRRLIIPPSLGYGANRHGIIPPNTTLLFNIQLLAISSSS
jgi:FKBP-type peptidyl-prolyl cis-trans isomerase FkpA